MAPLWEFASVHTYYYNIDIGQCDIEAVSVMSINNFHHVQLFLLSDMHSHFYTQLTKLTGEQNKPSKKAPCRKVISICLHAL